MSLKPGQSYNQLMAIEQAPDPSGTTQVQTDPTIDVISQVTPKVANFKQRLNEVRERLKANSQ